MTVRRWETSKRSPRAEELPKLAAALDTTVSYLMGIDDPAQAEERERQGHEMYTPVGRGVELPVFSITACMGPGHDNELEAWTQTGTAWLDERVVGPMGPRRPYLINADGTSMEPRIHDGDRLLVNENVFPGQGDICLARFRVNGYFRDAVKYYYPSSGGFILRSSEGSGIPPLSFTHEEQQNREAFVVGRVMYIDRGESV